MNVEVVLAPNPGLFTGPGTNTWIVSDGRDAIVIDPGPVIESHLAAIEQALQGFVPRAVLVTHTHPDHAPAANGLASSLGVSAIGFGPGPDFSPDERVADGDQVRFGGLEGVCVATPGHTPDSVSYRFGDALFAGDHIMGGSTVIVEDMTDYMASLEKLQGTGLETIYPGHGPRLDDPDHVVATYLEHRRERERQIVAALERGATCVGDIVRDVYQEVDEALHPAAAVSVGSHLVKLRSDGRVVMSGEPEWNRTVELA